MANIKHKGMMHIRLPFTSLDDVSFEGTYAPAADALVAMLKDHMNKQDYKKQEYEDGPMPEAPQSELQKVVDKYKDPFAKLIPKVDPSRIDESYHAE